MLLSFAALLLAALSLTLFNYAFPPWKIVLYAVSIVLLSAAAVLFVYNIVKNKGKNKKLIRALIGGAVFAAIFMLLTMLINNVILGATKSALAAKIITCFALVFFAVIFALSVKSSGKKVFPSVLSVILAAVIGFAPVIPEAVNSYRIKNAKPVAAPTGFSEFTKAEKAMVKNADFYVSPSGSDKNDGSFDKPFATIEKARDAVKALDKSGKKGITVAVMAGEYRTAGIEFTKEDGGTKDCPVTYIAYGDGEVILNGGVTLKPESFKKVTDEAVLSRLCGPAQDSVLCADLAQYGLGSNEIGKIYAIGSYNTAAKYDGDYVGGIYCELFVNDKRQTLARYPDSGWLYTEKVIETGLGRESDGALTAVENWDEIRNPAPDVYSVSKELSNRIASWKTLDDVWMFGFWKYDWADASSPIGRFDAEKCELSPMFVSTYGTKEGAPYYFFNVLEELDAPGEWYLDRDTNILYIYPDCDLNTAAVDLSVTSSEIIKITDAEYLTFDGFTVKGTRGDAIIANGNNITVQNCLIKNIAGNAVYMNGYNNLAYANEITRTGKGGISINGGDRETLTPGNSKADNNFIHDWSEIYQTYQPAVSLGGVGNICSHNEIYNSPHEAITYGGNNHIIEYNNIHDVCLLSDDAGAIYAGRRWDFYGTQIRFNAVYNLGSGGHTPDGIYMDDALSGQTIYGNILVNVPKIGIHLGGGRDMTVKNNLIINTNNCSISYDQRARDGVFGGWFTHSSQKDGDMWTNLFESPWQTDVWKEAYPQMQKFSDNFDDTDNPGFVPNPAYSEVTNNIIVNLTKSIGNISEAANKYSNISGNMIISLSKAGSLFTDIAGGNYTLSEIIDSFEQIPFDKIGRY